MVSVVKLKLKLKLKIKQNQNQPSPLNAPPSHSQSNQLNSPATNFLTAAINTDGGARGLIMAAINTSCNVEGLT